MALTITGIGLIGLLVALYFQNKNRSSKLQKINHNRPGLTRTEYIEQLMKKGFEKKHIEVVYDEIKKLLTLDSFSLYPEDDIHELYGFYDLDDVELIDNICQSLNIDRATQSDCDELNKKFSKTDAEYILTLTKQLECK